MNHQNSPPQETALPTPISPTVSFESLISQFSINTKNEPGTSKSFPCPDCDQVFHRAHSLKSHRITHSNAKPFQCTDCEKQFLRLHDLKRHQKLHTGERPYHCPVCKRSFSRLDALNRHRKTEGGSACLKTSPVVKKDPLLYHHTIPSMTSQWQVSPLQPPLPLPVSHTKPTILNSASPYSPPLLPSLIQLAPNDDLVEDLRSKIHDLEIENRVLRSLLCNNEQDKEFKRQKRSPQG